MPEASATKLYNTFTKGLITEASPLTYPKDASIDEDNCELFIKGNRVRRLGIDYEPSAQLVTATATPKASVDTVAQREFKWISPNNSAVKSFLCQQIGANIYVYDMTAVPMSSGLLTTLTMVPTANSDVNTLAATPMSFSAGNGFMFVCSAAMEPVCIAWDDTSFTVNTLRVLIRDFDGVDDGLSPDDRPHNLSNLHAYNLFNQGFFPTQNHQGNLVTYYTSFGVKSTHKQGTESFIQDFFNNQGVYPPNNLQWWYATGSDHSFSSNAITNFAMGNSLAPRGHYIVEAFDLDRTAVSGYTNVPGLVTNTRPNTTAFFSGRVWWGSQNTVYYSQILTPGNFYQANFCCQLADPTSEKISQLVASDGGRLVIPEAGTIVKLYAFGAGLVVLATNGVWFVGGGSQGGFSATDLSVIKLSPVGMDSPESVVSTTTELFWWSKIGIQGLSMKSGFYGSSIFQFEQLNLTEESIRTFYFTKITDTAKRYAKAQYDPATNRVMWLFKTNDNLHPYLYNRVLMYDLTLKSFWPWTFTTVDGTTPYVSGFIDTIDQNIIPNQPVERRNTFIKFILQVPVGSNYETTFGLVSNSTFSDWKKFDPKGVGYDFSSYVETGYELLEDALRRKQAPWLIPYFKRTEQNFVAPLTSAPFDYKPVDCPYLFMFWKDPNANVIYAQPGYTTGDLNLPVIPKKFDATTGALLGTGDFSGVNGTFGNIKGSWSGSDIMDVGISWDKTTMLRNMDIGYDFQQQDTLGDATTDLDPYSTCVSRDGSYVAYIFKYRSTSAALNTTKDRVVIWNRTTDPGFGTFTLHDYGTNATNGQRLSSAGINQPVLAQCFDGSDKLWSGDSLGNLYKCSIVDAALYFGNHSKELGAATVYATPFGSHKIFAITYQPTLGRMLIWLDNGTIRFWDPTAGVALAGSAVWDVSDYNLNLGVTTNYTDELLYAACDASIWGNWTDQTKFAFARPKATPQTFIVCDITASSKTVYPLTDWWPVGNATTIGNMAWPDGNTGQMRTMTNVTSYDPTNNSVVTLQQGDPNNAISVLAGGIYFIGNVVPVADFTTDFPSSCLLTTKWDWSSSVVSNKWQGPYEVYRLSRVPYVDPDHLTLDTGFPLVQNRFKVRGRGKALEFRFESRPLDLVTGTGYDFNLLGWAVEYAANAKP